MRYKIALVAIVFGSAQTRRYGMQRINSKGVLFHCTCCKVPQGSNIYINYKACKKEAGPKNLEIDHCPGKMMVAITQEGKVSLPFFLPRYTFGTLSTTKNIDLGDLNVQPLLEMISPTLLVKDVLPVTSCQAIIDVLSSNKEMWHGLNGGNSMVSISKKKVLDLESNHKMNKLVEWVMQPLIKNVQFKYTSLVYVTNGALQSAPNCPSQYSGHQDVFYSGYKCFY
jgi:hypothetical protein